MQIENFKELISMISAIVEDDNKAEINGREYQLSKMNHGQRLPFFQYYQDMQPNPMTGIAKESMDYAKIEAMLGKYCLVDGALLSKVPDHFDKYPEDYLQYINTMFMVVIYPFLKGSLTKLMESSKDKNEIL